MASQMPDFVPEPSAVIFDLDGTLIDSAPSIREAVNAMLAEVGRPPLSLAEVKGFIGNGLPMLVTRVMAARELDPSRAEEIFARVSGHYARLSLEAPHFYPGALEALQRLAAQGHRLGLCTNKPVQLAQAILEDCGIAGLFGAVLGGDSLPVRKPDPQHLLATVEKLGGGAAIFVGDSEIDAETAERAALPFLLFTGGYAKRPVAEIPAAVRFDHHDALPRHVAELQPA